MKILVVENDDDMAALVVRMLAGGDGLEVAAVICSPSDVVDEVQRLRPDLVILDQFLDGAETGIAIAPRIKAISPETKILLFSALDLAWEASKEPAIDAFLPKRHLRELTSAVAGQLDQRAS
jgi:two-component SAPR family response regulator